MLVLGSSGCRSTSDNQIDLLERELRVQEDYIYELEGYVVDYSEKLRDCRGCAPPQTAAYSEELYHSEAKPQSTNKRASQRDDKERSIIDSEERDLPPPDDPQRAPEVNPEDMEVPDLDLDLDDPVTNIDGDYADDIATVELEYEPADGQVMLIPDPVDFDSPLDDPSNTTSGESELAAASFDATSTESDASVQDRRAERLQIAELFRGEGDRQSPITLLTVVEALDKNDEPVDLDGEVSLMLMTPEESGKLKRLKRWNFTPEETSSAWQSSELGDGLHLELPLESTKLPNKALELWVRLVAADGRKLLTQIPFEPGELTAMNDEPSNSPTIATKLTDAKSSRNSLNPLRTGSAAVSTDKNVKLADDKSTTTQSGWRSATRHASTNSGGLVGTTATAKGWTKQSPSQLRYQTTKTAVSRPSTSTRQ